MEEVLAEVAKALSVLAPSLRHTRVLARARRRAGRKFSPICGLDATAVQISMRLSTIIAVHVAGLDHLIQSKGSTILRVRSTPGPPSEGEERETKPWQRLGP